MSDKKYWIWLSQALGAGARVDEILSAFPEPEKLYFADDAERMTAGVFTRRQLERLNKTKLSDAETAIRVCAKNGWEICVPTDGDYPEELKRLADMPLVLYVDGDISRIKDKISIGIVGTRQPSYDSTCIARTVAGDLASAGAAVISARARMASNADFIVIPPVCNDSILAGGKKGSVPQQGRSRKCSVVPPSFAPAGAHFATR